jgi:hypothetical protein
MDSVGCPVLVLPIEHGNLWPMIKNLEINMVKVLCVPYPEGGYAPRYAFVRPWLKIAMITMLTAFPVTGALASTNVQYTNGPAVLSINPSKSRPALSDHLGGQVRVRNHYADGSLNNQLLEIMFNEHR